MDFAPHPATIKGLVTSVLLPVNHGVLLPLLVVTVALRYPVKLLQLYIVRAQLKLYFLLDHIQAIRVGYVYQNQCSTRLATTTYFHSTSY